MLGGMAQLRTDWDLVVGPTPDNPNPGRQTGPVAWTQALTDGTGVDDASATSASTVRDATDTAGATDSTSPALTSAPAAGTNMLAARSAAIDSGDVASAGVVEGGNGTLAADDTWAAPGRTRSLRFTLTGTSTDSGVQLYTDGGVTPGNAYRITAIAKRTPGSTSTSDALYVTVKWRTASALIYQYQGAMIDTGTSVVTTTTFTAIAPEGAVRVGVIVRYGSGTSAGASFQLGDVISEELPGYVNPSKQYELAFCRPRASLFAPSNIWNLDVSAAPLASNSTALINTFLTDDLGVSDPVFNLLTFASSTYVVSKNHPRMNIGFLDAQKKLYTDGKLYAAGTGFFRDIPIPWDAVSGGGGDSHMTILCPELDLAVDDWQFYKDRATTLSRGGVTPSKAAAGDYSYRTADEIAAAGDNWNGYSATWGGKITNLSSNVGIFPVGTGTSATGIAAFGGTVGILEAQAGVIDHALYMSIVYPRSGIWSYPANRSDGYVNNVDNLMEGQRLRLDPTLDLSTLSLSPLGRMIAVAMQKYGAIVGDKTGAVEFEGESPRPYLARGLANPWTPILAASPVIYKNFPWSRMQALPADYGKP